MSECRRRGGALVLRAPLAALVALVPLGCSLLFDAQRSQCRTASDCRASSTELLRCEDGLCVSASSLSQAQRFDCRGSLPYTYPADLPLEFDDFNQGGPAQAAGVGRPIALEVRLCRDADPGCQTPVEGPTPTDALGRTSVRLTEPNLHLELKTIKADAPLYPPAYLGPADALRALARLRPDGVAAVSVAQTSVVTLVAQLAGAPNDPTRGQLIVTTLPCADTDAVGLEYTTAEAAPGTRYYVGSGAPDFGSAATLRGFNYPLANGGFINVPPGPAEVAIREPGLDVDVLRVKTEIRAGWTTYVLGDIGGRVP